MEKKRKCPYCESLIETYEQKFKFHSHNGGLGLPLCFGAALHIPTLEALGEMK